MDDKKIRLEVGEEIEIELSDGSKIMVRRLSTERPKRLDRVHAEIMEEIEMRKKYLQAYAEAFM